MYRIIPNEQTPAVPFIVDIQEFIATNKDMLQGLMEFASKQRTAIGLAANQCSYNDVRINLRAFALMDLETKEWSIAIDPVIVPEVKFMTKKLEGCLTWVGQMVLADRYARVRVKYFDIEGIPRMQIVEGLEAQLWQHETNHLDGVTETIVSPNYILPSPAGRNDSCPCGSGKKYKKCCININ